MMGLTARNPDTFPLTAPLAPLEVVLHLGATALIDDLASHGIAGVGEAVARGAERAAHAVCAFPDDHLDRFGALAEHADLDLLAGACDANLDSFDLHYAARRARSIGATMSAEFGAANRSPWQTRQPASVR